MNLPTRQISGFKKEGRRAAKIVVLVDGEPWATLDPETVVRERLRTGEGLDAARQSQILATDETIRARKAAAGHGARSPKTRHELERFLRERRFTESAIQAALAMLEASGTLDDERAAEWLIRSRRRRRDVGPRRLEADLRTQGFTPAEAGERLGEALAGVDWVAECLALARKTARRYEPLAETAQRRKLAAALARRGYELDVVWAAIRRLLAERGERADEE